MLIEVKSVIDDFYGRRDDVHKLVSNAAFDRGYKIPMKVAAIHDNFVWAVYSVIQRGLK